ncbi:acetylornithine deacetylase [Azospirillum thiophilum]|uniref:Acetylornithine deacetylase n=1 Tax=Azospirillum thiophilum TaxID=528244 RepID=A0AAC8W0P1_9PROT|nr:acetylornithine deacetylase [Azospirillum thiophilum]ALG72975.1 acetylornithine deacetylase [Azospirillum thiophilum]KJR64109.1 acetylornithine deacetylase [Azospirillum thiophilum]
MTSRDILSRLVGFDTVSSKSNLALIDWVRDYLEQQGIRSDLIHDETGTKAHLWATVGPECDGGIVLSGHTDVVPVDGQSWSSDPFTLTEREGKLFGRGTADMKGFIAVALNAVERFKAASLDRPVHLAFSYDEEIGCIGVPSLLEAIRRRGIRPAACIVGEPTMMKLVIGHKGILCAHGHVRGFECHSSTAPEGVNAVQYAARIIDFVRLECERRYREGPFDHRFIPSTTTLHVGTVQGGTAFNIVPRDCRFDLEIRHLPTEDPHRILQSVERHCRDVLEPEMRAVAPDTGITLSVFCDTPGFVADPGSDIAVLLRRITGDNDSAVVAYTTEAGHFSRDGYPTIVCGPGSMAQGHKPDEFIEVSQLAAGDRFMEALAGALGRVSPPRPLP